MVRPRFSLSRATTVRFPTLSSDNSDRDKKLYSGLRALGTDVCASRVLTVKAKVLGEGLSYEQLKALGDEEANGPGVFLQTARGKALIGRVKERKQLPPLEKRQEQRETGH